MRYLLIALILSGCSSIPMGESEPAKKYSQRAMKVCGRTPVYERKDFYIGWYVRCSWKSPKLKIGTVADVWSFRQ